MIRVRIGYTRIRRRVDELLADQIKPPVDVEAIAEANNVAIKRMELEKDISGILFRAESGNVIVVNSLHNDLRQRFTIAHELGHLMLHDGEEVHVDQEFRVNLRDIRSTTAEHLDEREANAFAANLLMPAAWLKQDVAAQDIDMTSEEDLRKLASLYEVSMQAMTIRLLSLFSD